MDGNDSAITIDKNGELYLSASDPQMKLYNRNIFGSVISSLRSAEEMIINGGGDLDDPDNHWEYIWSDGEYRYYLNRSDSYETDGVEGIERLKITRNDVTILYYALSNFENGNK